MYIDIGTAVLPPGGETDALSSLWASRISFLMNRWLAAGV